MQYPRPRVQALVAAGYEVFGVNPMAVARYRERHSTSGAKSDAACDRDQQYLMPPSVAD